MSLDPLGRLSRGCLWIRYELRQPATLTEFWHLDLTTTCPVDRSFFASARDYEKVRNRRHPYDRFLLEALDAR